LLIQYFPHVRRQQFWHFFGAYQLLFIVCNFERRSKTKVIPERKCLFLCLHVRLICALNYYLLTYLPADQQQDRMLLLTLTLILTVTLSLTLTLSINP